SIGDRGGITGKRTTPDCRIFVACRRSRSSLRQAPTRFARQSVLPRPAREARFGRLLLASLGNRFFRGPLAKLASAGSYSLRSAIGSSAARSRSSHSGTGGGPVDVEGDMNRSIILA